MELNQAKIIAERYVERLRPHCERIAIAGSIRREVSEVNDIEIVCIPKRTLTKRTDDLFGSDVVEVVSSDFQFEINQLEKVKGEPSGKYTQRLTPEGIKIDFFMCRKANWGFIFTIRTGSARYSKMLADRWVKLGYKGIEGYLYKDNVKYDINEEWELFDLLNMKYVEPTERNY